MLSKGYEGEAVRNKSVFEWYKKFKEGHKNNEDDERSGHPPLTEPIKMLKKWGNTDI